MVRAVAAMALTILGLYLVLTFKTSPMSRITGASASQPPVDSTTAAPPLETPAPVSRTIDGPVVAMRWGDVQVAVTLRGSTITDVSAIMVPTERPRSAYINGQAVPMLRGEVITAQSANIDVISGATYTSQAYAQSLQAALDAAHA